MHDLARNLRAARRKRKLTQEEVAERSGVQQGEVSRIEAGKRDPQVSTLLRIAEALEVSPGSLLDGIADSASAADPAPQPPT